MTSETNEKRNEGKRTTNRRKLLKIIEDCSSMQNKNIGTIMERNSNASCSLYSVEKLISDDIN